MLWISNVNIIVVCFVGMKCLKAAVCSCVVKLRVDIKIIIDASTYFNFQNEVPDAEPECDPSSVTAARSLWNDRMALAGSNELTIEVQDYIPFS